MDRDQKDQTIPEKSEELIKMLQEEENRKSARKRFEKLLGFLGETTNILQEFTFKSGISATYSEQFCHQLEESLKNEAGEMPYNTDFNGLILHIFCHSLHYYINEIEEEDADLQYFFVVWRNMCPSILALVKSPILLRTEEFKNVVFCWISDLLKIITGADGEIRKNPKYLSLFNLIMKILVNLSSFDPFLDHLLREIMKKFDHFLSFCQVNPNFSQCVRDNSTPMLYLILIMKGAIGDAVSREYSLPIEDKLKYREMLEKLAKCLVDGKSGLAVCISVNEIFKMLY